MTSDSPAPPIIFMDHKPIPDPIPEDAILVWPNDPTDRKTCADMARAISKGYRVCIWIVSPYSRIDLMDYRDAGYDVIEMIRESALSGERAKSAFRRWQRMKPITDDEKI